jgi:hypothetical protein
MHKRHQKTLDDIFRKPDRKDIPEMAAPSQ